MKQKSTPSVKKKFFEVLVSECDFKSAVSRVGFLIHVRSIAFATLCDFSLSWLCELLMVLEKRSVVYRFHLFKPQRHLNYCKYTEVTCPKNCGESLERQQVEGHFNECVNRLAACEHCGHHVVFADMNVSP